MSTLLTAWCVHCRGAFDIPNERRTAVVRCPHCGREMDARSGVEYRQRFHQTRRRIWLSIMTLAILAAGGVGYWYRLRFLSGFDLLVEITGSSTVAALSLAGGLLVLLWMVVWLAFPIMMYVALKDLRGRTAELEETSRLCARHLARLSGNRDAFVRGQSSDENVPETPLPPTET